MALDELFEAVREACPRGLWSLGVKLARDRAVTRDSASDGEIVVRVAAPGRAVAPTVVLYPGELEWDCDCGARAEACAHTAAAVIALREGGELAPATAAVRWYRFSRGGEDSGPVTVGRDVVGAGPLRPTQADLQADRLLGDRERTPLAAARVAQLFSVLAGCEHASLDGRPVRIGGEPVLPRALVTDRAGQVRLAVVADPTVDDIPGDRVALCGGDTLRPLAYAEVAGERWERLPLVRDYADHELGELVTTMLPALRRDVEVEVRSRRLPGVTDAGGPRVHLELSGEGQRLSVLPLLVYGDPPLARIDGDRLVQLRAGTAAPVRDRRAEAEAVTELRDRLNMVPGRRVTVAGAEARSLAERVRTYQRGEESGQRGEALFEVALAPRLAVRDVADSGPPAAEFDLWFETDEEVAGERRRAAASAVVAAWQNGLDLVPLEGGGWAPLPGDFLARHGHRVLDLLAARGQGGRVSAVAVPALSSLCDAMDIDRPRAARRLATILEQAGGIPPARLPSGFRGELRPYQQSGVDWLCALRESGFGAVLADDMGLGKTVQALATFGGGAGAGAPRTLVVCPTSVLHNWAAETARFRPDLTVCLYHGPRRELSPDADLVLTSYAILRLDRDQLGAAGPWATVVLDESQNIKNPDSQAAQAAFTLPAEFRVALSGTPIENRLDELWSVCHFTNPGLLGPRKPFVRRLAGPIAAGDAGAAGFLRDKIRPFVLRRLKREVAPELPPRTEAILEVELDDNERATYDAVRAAARADLVAQLSAGRGVMEALEVLLRLRQAACHPSLVPGQHAETSSKVACLLDALDTACAEGHKSLVFSQWTSLLDLVEPHLRAADIGFCRLDGSTTNRAGVVAEFQDPDGPPVMIASLKAGGTGLNLTAADHVFILDPWWNPAAEDQAADRAHRIGQDKPVMVYRLVTQGTVEERVLALKERKRALADAVLAEAGRAVALTRDDLVALLD